MAQEPTPLASRSGTTPSDASGPADGRPIVAFDFDGTLTIRDSFTAFLAWRAGTVRYRIRLAKLIPAAVLYLFRRDRGRIKAAATAVFLKGTPRATLEAEAERFAAEQFDRLMRPDALAAWRRWGEDGAYRVIVTASPDDVVAPFARRLGADELIGTRLAYDRDGRVAGAFETPNCRGPEKVVRLKARFGEGMALAAAYGDTGGDKEMLEMAQERGFRVFTGRP